MNTERRAAVRSAINRINRIMHRNRGIRPIGTNTAIADALAGHEGPMAVDVLATTIGESPSTVRARVEALDNLGIVSFNKANHMVALNSKWG